jgi:hypothetical protein
LSLEYDRVIALAQRCLTGSLSSAFSPHPLWYADCGMAPTAVVKGVFMRRLPLAFAAFAGVILSVVPVAAQRATRTTQLKPRVTQTAVQQELQRNAIVREAVRVRLPEGTNLNTAAGGFRRLELFVATVNASSNLGIPFFELKRRIVNDGMTLGQAIQDIRPASKYWTEARRAEEDAAATIRTSESVTIAAEKKTR